MEVCVELGGSITGEHGVGVEKQNEMPLMFTETELEVMRRIKVVHDADELCNPNKIFPQPDSLFNGFNKFIRVLFEILKILGP